MGLAVFRPLSSFEITEEHLILGDQRERLKQAWLVHGLKQEGTTTSEGLAQVLEAGHLVGRGMDRYQNVPVEL